MNITNIIAQFGEYLYQRLPQVYRDYDVEIQRVVDGETKIFKTLQEYLYCFAEGGFQPLLEDLEAILNLIDPMNCPEEFLPLLLQHFGLTFVEDIPSKFQRRLVQNIITLYKKKGTLPALAFLARELSGFDVDIEEITVDGVTTVNIKISAYENEKAELFLVQDTIQRYIHLFLPTTVRSNIVVAYGFSEGVNFNSISESADYPVDVDNALYDIDEDYADHLGKIWDIQSENYDALNQCVEEDFSNVKVFNGFDEDFSVYPFDITSLTNYLESDYVYTNGICGEDVITQNLSTQTSNPITVNNLENTYVSVERLDANSIEDVVFPICKYTGILHSGDVLRFLDVENNVYGYLVLDYDLYGSESCPTTFQLDLYNKVVRIYNQYCTLVLDGTQEFVQRTGYLSFSTIFKGIGYPRDFSDLSVDDIYIDGEATISDSAMNGLGDTGVLYVYAKSSRIYLSCPDVFYNDTDVKNYLRLNPITLHSPVRCVGNEGSTIGFTVSGKYLKPSNPTSISPTDIVCEVYSDSDLYSTFTKPSKVLMESATISVTDENSNTYEYDLGIPLIKMGQYSDYIKKEGNKYYLYSFIGKWGITDIVQRLNTYTATVNSMNEYGFIEINIGDSPIINEPEDYFYFNLLPCGFLSQPLSWFINNTSTKRDNYNDVWDFIHITNKKPVLNRTQVLVFNATNLFFGSAQSISLRWNDCFKYSDIEPKFYFVRSLNPEPVEITDENILNKLTLLPIPDDYAIISTKGIFPSRMDIKVESRKYY